MDNPMKNQKLYKALAAFQSEIPEIPKNKQGYGYKYASLDSILQVIRPLLAKNGLCVHQGLQYSENGEEFVHTVVAHESGELIESRLKLRIAKPDSQALGAALTYGRRYLLSAMLGLQPDEDLDGVTSDEPNGHKVQKVQNFQSDKKITGKQLNMLLGIVKGDKNRLQKICDHYGISYVEELTLSQASEVLEKLNKERESV